MRNLKAGCVRSFIALATFTQYWKNIHPGSTIREVIVRNHDYTLQVQAIRKA